MSSRTRVHHDVGVDLIGVGARQHAVVAADHLGDAAVDERAVATNELVPGDGLVAEHAAEEVGIGPILRAAQGGESRERAWAACITGTVPPKTRMISRRVVEKAWWVAPAPLVDSHLVGFSTMIREPCFPVRPSRPRCANCARSASAARRSEAGKKRLSSRQVSRISVLFRQTPAPRPAEERGAERGRLDDRRAARSRRRARRPGTASADRSPRRRRRP